MPRKPTVRIHVNSHVLRANARHGRDDPAITVRAGRRLRRCKKVVTPTFAVVQGGPLACGARVWVEYAGAYALEGEGP